MTPSRLQVPQHAPSARVTGDPPESRTVLSLRPEKKPSRWPSGDQNGEDAPVVSGISSESSESNARTKSTGGPSGRLAVKASLVPSGDSAGTSRPVNV